MGGVWGDFTDGGGGGGGVRARAAAGERPAAAAPVDRGEGGAQKKRKASDGAAAVSLDDFGRAPARAPSERKKTRAGGSGPAPQEEAGARTTSAAADEGASAAGQEDMDEFGFIDRAGAKLTPLESQVLSLKRRYQRHRGAAPGGAGEIGDIDVLFVEVGPAARRRDPADSRILCVRALPLSGA